MNHSPNNTIQILTTIPSGATHPSTPSQPAPSSPPPTSTTSATSATATPPSSTVPLTPPPANSPASPTSAPISSRSAPPATASTRNSSKKTTTTGPSGMPRKKMAWAAGAGATRILLMWRARRVVVFRSGWRLLVGLSRRLSLFHPVLFFSNAKKKMGFGAGDRRSCM